MTTAVLLDKVQKGKPISDEAIKMLRKEKLIEGRKPHLYVSKQIAGVTDQKVEYSKHKGLAAYSGDSRSPIPMISVHSVGDLLYRRQS